MFKNEVLKSFLLSGSETKLISLKNEVLKSCI